MTYDPNIPQASDLISQSQSQIQTNFSQADSIFDQDHFTFDDATVADRGKHRQSTYVELGADPTTAADEIALYSKDTSGSTRLYLRQESAGTVVQMSGRDPTAGSSGETFLPGGLLLKWGNIVSASNASTQNFSTPFPNNCYVVVVTENIASSLSTVGVNGFTTTGFTFRTGAGGGVPITYIAIGN